MFNAIQSKPAISLTPGFSPVRIAENPKYRFNGFSGAGKAVETAYSIAFRFHPAEAGR
jgi:hypothetical protein